MTLQSAVQTVLEFAGGAVDILPYSENQNEENKKLLAPGILDSGLIWTIGGGGGGGICGGR